MSITPTPTKTPVPSPSYGNVQQLFRRYKDGQLVAQVEQYKPFYGYQYVQMTPTQQWNVPHYKSQVALYNIFDTNNEQIIPSKIIEVDNCNTQIVFNNPVAGFANIVFLAGENTGLICTITPTPSPTPTITVTPSVTPSMSVSASPSPTPSFTPTATFTPTVTSTLTPTPSVTTSSSGSTYDEVVESHGPSAYWPLNTNLDDVIGHNNLVYPTSPEGVDFISDAYGHYLYFDSPSSGLNFTTPISLTNTFSLEAWFEVEEFTAAPPSDGFFTIFGTDIYGLQFDSSGQLYIFGNSDAVYPVSSGSPFLIDADTLYHLVVTVDASGNVIFYFNGTAYLGNSPITETYNFQYLGTDNSQEYFYGMIGNPAIYDFVLTPEQIQADYNAGTNNYRYANPIVLPTPSPTLSLQLLTQTPTPSVTPSITPTLTPTPTPAPSNLFRLNSSGAIDNTYGSMTTNFPVVVINEINDLIYVGGAFSTVNGLTYNDLFRLTLSGAIDTTFTNIVLQNTIQGIYANPDGHIYIGGGVLYNSVDRGILRLNSDGTVDDTYTVILSGGPAEGVNIFLPSSTATGAMLVLGEFSQGSYNSIARLNADGSIDETFTPITFSYTSQTQYVQTAYQTTDGHIYVGGQFTSVNGSTARAYLIRLNSDGTIDETFTDLGLTEPITAICQGSDGHIYVGGYMTTSSIRLNSDGTLDNTYTSVISGVPDKMYVTADGKIYVSNLFSIPVIRLNSDGSLDNTFVSIGVSGTATFYQTTDGNIYVGQ
jgi:uncharacterized delta-60 repeat protein